MIAKVTSESYLLARNSSITLAMTISAPPVTAATPRQQPVDPWDQLACKAIIAQLWALREKMLRCEANLAHKLAHVDPSYHASAKNFVHYLKLRESDRRLLQEQLAELGLSSLGRSESNVLANLDKVIGILHRLTGQPWQAHGADEPVGIHSSQHLLGLHTSELLGIRPAERAVRIMVTLPSEAASDPKLIRELTRSGMDIARINCAHDGPDEWRAMAANVHSAALAERRPVRILMDLGGPKLRTGRIAPGVTVLKLRPLRDEFGRVVTPFILGLRSAGTSRPVVGADALVGVEAPWLAQLTVGDRLELTDARGAERHLTVIKRTAGSVLAEGRNTTYLTGESCLRRAVKNETASVSRLFDLPEREGTLHLVRGGKMRLSRGEPKPADFKRRGTRQNPIPTVACTLPEIFEQAAVGERIWFDDGRIGGIIRGVHPEWLDIEITQARDSGEKLAGDKGINLPDSNLNLPALTDKDIDDLAVVAEIADMVGLSFVQRGHDVDTLRSLLRELGKPDLGIVLKIETRRAFENLPELLFSAMAGKAAGIMIARGDLAVECGYERLAEVQEEILWAAEAAHMPVIWATQVLETLAKTGLPSRAEITDAAMGERAECVMLNKGPHITDAMRTLDDILRRMQAHQAKKRPLLRALKAWSRPDDGAQTATGMTVQ